MMYVFVTFCAAILGVLNSCLASSGPSPDVLTLTAAVSRFSQKLYMNMTSYYDKAIYSPLSTHIALTMVYLGARGTTADQMQSVLQLSGLPQPHEAYKSLIQYLNDIQRDVIYIRIGTSFTADSTVLAKYRKDVVNYYSTISNDIVREEVSSTIIYEPPLTLHNQLYFNGIWKSEFNPVNTYTDDFKNKDGLVKNINFMTQFGRFGVKLSAVENVDVVRIPFKNDRFAFYIVLPRTVEDFSTLEKIISGDNFDDAVFFNGVNKIFVNITIPKFKVASILDIETALENLGMTVALSDKPDFSGIMEQKIPIKFVSALAMIQISEKGTYDATIPSGSTRSVATGLTRSGIVADHPFIFYVRDDESKLILLQGKLTDPSEIIITIDNGK